MVPPRRVSKARRISNRKSAAKSTGPQTPRGKALVSRNAFKHGVFARVSPLYDEDDEGYAAFLARLDVALSPRDDFDAVMVEKIALALWRLRRLRRYERGLCAADLQRFLTSETMRGHKGRVPAELKDYAATRGFPSDERLDFILRYTAALDREWMRCYLLYEQRRTL